MSKFKNRFNSLIIFVIILALWQLEASLQLVNNYLLPSPENVVVTLVKMIKSGQIFTDTGISLLRILKGFSLAFLIAFTLGIISVTSPKVRVYYDTIIKFFSNVPPLSLIPLLILWCGIGEASKVTIIVLAAFFPMYLNITKGFLNCDPKLLEVAKIFKYSKLETTFKVILPNAVKDILVGMRIGLSYSWRAIIGAEMIAASAGLGQMIIFAQQMSQTDKIIVGIIVIGLIGFLIDYLFGKIFTKFIGKRYDNIWN